MTRQLNVKLGVGLLLIACMCLLMAAASQAASYSWNPAGGPVGTWDLSSSNWYLTSNVVWPNATDSIAVFGSGNPSGAFTTGGAVTVNNGGNAITVNGITFNLTGYTISGDPLTLTGTAPAITVTNGGTTAEIDSNITPTTDFSVAGNGNLILGGNVASASARNLTMSGAGTLTLGGGPGVAADNTLIVLNVTSGTAILGKASSASIHAVSSVSGVSPGATLQLGGTGSDQIYDSNNISGVEGTFDLNGLSETIGALSGTAGTLTNNVSGTTSTLTLHANTGTFSGTIQNGAAGAGIVALTVNGGTQTISGSSANTYTGLTTVSGGTLNLAKANAIGSGGLTITGGTLNINNAGALGAGTFTISGGTLNNTFGSAISLTTANPISITAGFTYTGSSDLNLGTGAVNMTASNPTINVNAGTLSVGGAITASGGFLKSNDGTLALMASSPAYNGTIDLRRGTLALGAVNALGTVNTNVINLDQGILQAAVPLTGANKVVNDLQLTNGVASNYNAFTAMTTEISGTNAIEFGGTLTKVGTGGTDAIFVYNTGGTTFSGKVYISEAAATARTLTINASGPTTFSNTIADFNGASTAHNGLQVTGNNTLTLSGANTFTGGTTLAGATTVLDYSTNNNDKIYPTSGLTVNGGAGLVLKGGSWAQNVSATTLSTGGDLNIARDAVNPGTATIVLKAITRNTGSGLNAATGTATTTTLNGSNGIMGGWATVDGTDWAVSGATAGTYAITALPAGSYQTGADSTPWATTDNVSITGNTALSASREIYTLKIGTTTTGQALNIGTGQALQLDSGGLLLTGSNDYTINGGTLQSGTATNSELIINQWGGPLTINSVIVNKNGTSTLTKAGTGTLILGASNTYTGTTFVANGTLKLGVNNAINSTNQVEVAGGGTFDLAGHTQSLGTGSNGGLIIANNTIGTATVTSSLPGGVLTLNTNDNGNFSNMLYTGQLALVIRDPGASNNFQLSNPFNSFSGGITAQGNGVFTLDKLTTTGISVVKGGIAVSANGTGGASTQVRINNQATSTGTFTIDNGILWTPSQMAYTINNPVAVTSNGGALFTDINGTIYNGAITSTGGTPLLVIGGDTSGRPYMALGGSMSGFTGTFAVDSANSDVNLSGAALGSPTANLLFFGNSTSQGIVRWNGAATPTTIQFAELMNGAVTVNGVNATFGTSIGVLDNNVSTTVTYQIGDNSTYVPTFGGVIKNTTGTVGVTKIGSNTQILSGPNTYTGTTSVTGGTLQITGTSNTSSSFTVNGGNLVFNNTGGIALNGTKATGTIANGSITANTSLNNLSLSINGGGTFTTSLTNTFNNIYVGSTTNGGVVVAGGSTPSTQGAINMVDSVLGTLTFNSPSATPALTLGGTAGNPAILDFDLLSGGADKIVLGTSTTFVVNAGGATVNIAGSGFSPGTYPIIQFPSGSESAAGALTIGTKPGGLYNFTLNTLSSEIDLVVTGNPVPSTAYWKNGVDAVWKDYTGSGLTATTNWSTDSAGATDAHQVPGGPTNVIFAANTGSGPVNTTLGQDFGVNGLEFTSAVGSSRPVTISGNNTLSIGAGGITVDSGSGTHTISTTGLAMTGSTQSWTNNSGNPFTISSALSGDAFAMLYINNGLFVLSGSGSTYAGSTIIQAPATVRIGSATALGTSQLFLYGALDLNGVAFTSGGLAGAGIVTNNNATPASINFNISASSGFDGAIQNGSGTISIIKSGTGSMSLTALNNYTGGTRINGGVLNIGNAGALGSTGNIAFTGGTLQYNYGIIADYAARVKNSTSPISVDATSQDQVWAGAIDSSNTGGLALVGGNLTLSGNNAYTGVNNIAGGTLKAGSSSALGNAANNIDIGATASLDLNGQTVTGGTVTLEALTNSSIITNSNTTTPAVLNADIMNYQGGLILTSPGDITFKRIDQAAGDSNGRLLTWDSPATLTLGDTASTDHNRMLRLVVSQGTVLLNMQAPVVGGVTNNEICLDRGLVITDGLVKLIGPSSNQIQDQIVVSFGTTAVGGGLVSGAGTPTLDLNGHSETISALSDGFAFDDADTSYVQNSAVGNTSTLTLNTLSDTTFAGVIRDHDPVLGGGVMAVTKGSTGIATQTFTSINTYTGPTNINIGTLQLIGAGSIANSSQIAIASGAVLDVSATSAVYATGVGQIISGSGSIVGSYTHGQGTLAPGTVGTAGTLTFDNSTAGGTVSISGGAINFDVSNSTSSGNDLIALNGGTGVMSGPVTVNVSTILGYVLGGTYTVVSQSTGSFTPPTIGGGGWTATWDRRGAAPTLASTANSVTVTLPSAVGAAANLKWSGSAGNAWDIVTSLNWYNTSPAGMDKYYRGDNVTFADTYVGSTAPANTAITLNAVVDPTSVTFNNSAVSYSLAGTGGISGATSLVKSGSGTLTITMTNSANNSYTGGTVINGGILSVSDDNNVGADAGRVTINTLAGQAQAVLQATGTFGFAVARPFTIGTGGGAIQVASAATLTINSTSVDFEGPLAVQGDGALTVNLGGTPIVGAGASMSVASTSTLNVGGSDPFTSGSTHMNVANNGALNITSGSKTVGALSGTGNLTLSAGVNLTATSVAQNVITLGAGGTLTIAAIPGGPSARGSIYPLPAGSGPISPVPEPSTWAMLMLAAMGLGIYRRRSR